MRCDPPSSSRRAHLEEEVAAREQQPAGRRGTCARPAARMAAQPRSSSRTTAQSFDTLPAGTGDVRETRVRTGDAFKWCAGSAPRAQRSSLVCASCAVDEAAVMIFPRRQASCRAPRSQLSGCAHMIGSSSDAYLGSCSHWMRRTPAARAQARKNDRRTLRQSGASRVGQV
jgi:hypothetical protein